MKRKNKLPCNFTTASQEALIMTELRRKNILTLRSKKKTLRRRKPPSTSMLCMLCHIKKRLKERCDERCVRAV